MLSWALEVEVGSLGCNSCGCVEGKPTDAGVNPSMRVIEILSPIEKQAYSEFLFLPEPDLLT